MNLIAAAVSLIVYWQGPAPETTEREDVFTLQLFPTPEACEAQRQAAIDGFRSVNWIEGLDYHISHCKQEPAVKAPDDGRARAKVEQ